LLENDEKIYLALVEQLEAGRGYTLRGHSILRDPWMISEQYDRALFFHPPGGVALFWLFHRLAGSAGFALTELCSFAIFYWSTILLGRLVLGRLDLVAALALAIPAAFTPIVAQVTGRLWLDGPLVAFSTAAVAGFFWGIKQRRMSVVCLAGALLGYASLIKLTAFLVVPGVVALAWAIAPRGTKGDLLRATVAWLAVAGAIQLPWEIVQWRLEGSPFPAWAGKPSVDLVATNAYVHYLTATRSPLIYLELLPQVIWTLVPSVCLLACQWPDRELRRRGAALVLWMAVVVGALSVAGAFGYSKVLRYVILVTPAAIVLFALVVTGAADVLGSGAAGRRARALRVLLLVAFVSLGLEVAQGAKTALFDNAYVDLIIPLLGIPAGAR
jgi:4-amino-4-deoxy-L-arabinose transferase-like glycosyltransferase